MTALRIHCFTSISLTYLDRARVLADTVRQHHPEWTLWLLVSDEVPPKFSMESSFDHIVRIADLEIPDMKSWVFGHDLIELCTAVKGVMLARLLPDSDAVIYLDPDIALFAPLTDVMTLIARHSIVLTPHLLAPESDFEPIPHNEIGSLKFGTYNLGFLAVRNCAEGARFATWWRDRLMHFCRDDIAAGLFVDQKWCDLVPTLFHEVCLLLDPGYNVASWNIGQRPIEIRDDGRILAAGHVLRFFHFTKINTIGESALERFNHGRTEVFELVHWYRERLSEYASPGLPDDRWAYGRYADQTLIPKAHRIAWRDRTELHDKFADPFASGPGTFQEWCATMVAG
jgi:hypothetical protein